jgi:hypothetical protein
VPQRELALHQTLAEIAAGERQCQAKLRVILIPL